jgi:hypothetical protein
MRRVVFAALTIVIVLGLAFEPHMEAQDRSSDLGSAAERQRIYDECVKPDRPKPEVGAGINNRDALLCGKAISLPKPSYPDEAKAQKLSGTVSVNIVIDEKRRAIWARVVEGPQLLHDVSIKAACHVRYTPMMISGRPVKAKGFVRYNFVSK